MEAVDKLHCFDDAQIVSFLSTAEPSSATERLQQLVEESSQALPPPPPPQVTRMRFVAIRSMISCAGDLQSSC